MMRTSRITKLLLVATLVLFFWRRSSSKGSEEGCCDDRRRNTGREYEERYPNTDVTHGDHKIPSGDSVTILLPVTSGSIQDLSNILSLLIVEANPLSHVVVIPPETIGKEARRVTLEIVSQLSFEHADVSVLISPHYLDPDRATLDVACRAATNWTVILDERGLDGVPPALRATLLSPHRSKTFGHQVVSLDMDCDQPSLCLLVHHSVPAKYPLPPFALSSHHLGLLASALTTGHYYNVWQAVGALMTQQDDLYRNGFLVWNESRALTYLYDGAAKAHQPPPETEFPRREDVATFLVVVTSVDDLRAFSRAACSLQGAGHSLHVVIYGGHENFNHHGLDDLRERVLPISLNCSIVYHEGCFSQGAQLARTLGDDVVDVLIHDADPVTYSTSLEQFVRRVVNDRTTHVHIPKADLPFTD